MRKFMLCRTGVRLIFIFLISFIAGKHESRAQSGLFSKQKVMNQYATLGIGGGSSHYFGDLAPYTFFYYGLYTNVRWNGSIHYTRFLTNNIGARVSFSYARIFGDDASFSERNFDRLYNNYLRNLHFRNDLKEFAITGIFNLIPQEGKGKRGRKNVMPYLTAGIGFVAHNPQARLVPVANSGVLEKQPWTSLSDKSTAGQGLAGQPRQYSAIALVVPLGAGVRFKINDKFDFTAEAGIRVTSTDYLDDVGNDLYVNPSVLSANFGTAAEKLAYRANQDINALTLESRIPRFLQLVQMKNGSVPPGVAPSNYAETLYGYSVGSRRGSAPPDLYLMTQFTISYVLSNSVKCPPIR